MTVFELRTAENDFQILFRSLKVTQVILHFSHAKVTLIALGVVLETLFVLFKSKRKVILAVLNLA